MNDSYLSSFDPETFMRSAQVDGELSTQTTPIPEGTYRGQIESVKPEVIETKAGKRVILRVNWELLDDSLKSMLERERVFIRQDIWLDLDSNGKIDQGKGKNVDLGRLRDALGRNSQAGNPFEGLVQSLAVVKTSVRSDANDPSKKYADVSRVSALT